MSEARTPLARVRLIDGRELVIDPDAARVGERSYAIARIQEARLLFLRPETIGLRMADVGLVEYTVARPGDGRVALDAIYHLRPDLLRADLEPPAPSAPAGYQVTLPLPPEPVAPLQPAYPAAPYMPYAPPAAYAPPLPRRPDPTPFPQQVVEVYGPEPGRRTATLTPQPRGAWRLVGDTFRLVGSRFGAFFALAIITGLLPTLALGALTVVVALLNHQDPFAATSLTQLQQALQGQAPATTQASSTADLLTLVIVAANLVLEGWTVATLTVAAREGALGRRVPVGGSLREGWRRLWPTLSALVITSAALLLVAVPGLAFSATLIVSAFTPDAARVSPAIGITITGMGVVMLLVTLALLAWLWPRLALAPTAAALGSPAPIRGAWSLAAGGALRILIALVVIGALTGALDVSATGAQFFSNGLAMLVIAPLAQLIAAPLSAVVRTLAYYDQRLRREGYTLFLQEGVTPPAAAPDATTLDPAAGRN